MGYLIGIYIDLVIFKLKKYWSTIFKKFRFRLLVNGSVLVNHEKNGSWYILEPESYCIDGMTNYGTGVDFEDGSVIDSSEVHQVLLVCKDAFKVKDMKVRYSIMKHYTDNPFKHEIYFTAKNPI